MDRTLRITGVKILKLQGSTELVDGFDVLVKGTRIHAIIETGGELGQHGAEQVLAFRNCVVMPGLVNAHTHSASALQRGRVPGDHLDLFLLEAMARQTNRGPQEIRVATLLHAMEMLRRGVTGAVDHFRHGRLPQPGSVMAALSAYEEIGLRAVVAPMFEDLKYIASLPIRAADLPPDLQSEWAAKTLPDPADYFSCMTEIVSEWREHTLTRVMLGVDGAQRCSPRLLELTGDFASAYAMGLHTHLLEAKTQALMAPSEFRHSLVAYLDKFGLISPLSSLAHFVWCNDVDIEIAADRQVIVVNNPVSNLILGSGIQPTARLLKAGIPVALGNDGASTSSVNLFEQAKLTSLLSRVVTTDTDEWIMPPRALHLATHGGAAALGLHREPQGIVPGALADLVVIKLGHAHDRPLGDIFTHLVMYENGNGVDTVLVDGEVVLNDGKFTRISEAAIFEEAQKIAQDEYELNIPNMAKAARERPIYSRLIQRELNKPFGFSRFANIS